MNQQNNRLASWFQRNPNQQPGGLADFAPTYQNPKTRRKLKDLFMRNTTPTTPVV